MPNKVTNIDTFSAVRPGLSRRGFLASLAASSTVLATGTGVAAGQPLARRAPAALQRAGHDGDQGTLQRGGVRLFNAPRLAPGARVRMPEGITAVPVEGYFHNRPRLVQTEYTWPYLAATDGAVSNASIIPARGSASHLAVLHGFDEGRYEVVHIDGSIDRVEWDAQELPYVWLWSEFGATKDLPFMGQFFIVALEPFSRNPIS